MIVCAADRRVVETVYVCPRRPSRQQITIVDGRARVLQCNILSRVFQKIKTRVPYFLQFRTRTADPLGFTTSYIGIGFHWVCPTSTPTLDISSKRRLFFLLNLYVFRIRFHGIILFLIFLKSLVHAILQLKFNVVDSTRKQLFFV